MLWTHLCGTQRDAGAGVPFCSPPHWPPKAPIRRDCDKCLRAVKVMLSPGELMQPFGMEAGDSVLSCRDFTARVWPWQLCQKVRLEGS